MKLNILGTEYDFSEATVKEDVSLHDNNGYCDSYKKQMAVKREYVENVPDCVKDMNNFKRITKRHEIIHAFLFESGMREWAEDEELVDWIALQFPKMLETFKQIEAI